MSVTQDIFWNNYTYFDKNNGSIDGDEFIWNSKYNRDGNSHLWHQKYSLPFTKVIGFVSCIFTSTVLGIGATEHSCSDVNTIKVGKMSAISSDVSDKHIIIYTSTCIESTITENIIMTNNLMTIIEVILGMEMVMILINS